MEDFDHKLNKQSIKIAIAAVNKYRQSLGSNGEKMTEQQKFDEDTSVALQDLRRLLNYLE